MKTIFFLNSKMLSIIQCQNYTHEELKKQLLCHIKAAAAFSDAQLPVAKDITENIKLNKDRDAVYKKIITEDKSSFISEIFAALTLCFCRQSLLLCVNLPGDNRTSHKKRGRLGVVLVFLF